MRAGSVLAGVERVREGIRRDEVVLLVVASDASERTRTKVLALAQARGVASTIGPSARELGVALGRGSLQVVGVMDANLAAGIASE